LVYSFYYKYFQEVQLRTFTIFWSKKQGYKLRLNISFKYNLPSESTSNFTHPVKKFSAFYEVQIFIPDPFRELYTFNAQPDIHCGPG